jgi:hypothetical protein
MDMCNSSNSSKTGSETGSSVRLVDGFFEEFEELHISIY